jgi:hypothetical protein
MDGWTDLRSVMDLNRKVFVAKVLVLMKLCMLGF